MTNTYESLYLAFLLRMWRENESTPWRATLENAHTNEQHVFADLIDLYTFLETVTGKGKGEVGGERSRGSRNVHNKAKNPSVN
jgi:hypothetical protein